MLKIHHDFIQIFSTVLYNYYLISDHLIWKYGRLQNYFAIKHIMHADQIDSFLININF